MKFATLAALAATVVADDSNPDWYAFNCNSDADCVGDRCAGHRDYADQGDLVMGIPIGEPGNYD